jgi:hypothetical protein
MRIAILGNGPAGLIAAHTLLTSVDGLGKDDIDIFDIKSEPSSIGGAQYLHRSILEPDSQPDGYVSFVQIGSPSIYARKVYGSPHVPTSWDHYSGDVPAWSLASQYERLFTAWKRRMKLAAFDCVRLEELVESLAYDQVYSSIPAPHICKRPDLHAFGRAVITIREIPEEPYQPNNIVIYSGREEDEWYRASQIFGHRWLEYGGGSHPFKPGEQSAFTGFKPLATTCDCFPEVERIGRYGTWERKLLLTDVPDQVRAALAARALA